MMRFRVAAFAALGAALAFACGDSADADHDDDAEHEHEHGDEDADGDDHAEGDDDHDHGDEDDEHGEAVELGTLELGDWSVKITGFGAFEDAGEGVLKFALPEGAAVTAVRAWYGIESGVGSMKSKIDMEGDLYHSHFEMPVAPPDGSEIWVEVEMEDGTTRRGSVPRP